MEAGAAPSVEPIVVTVGASSAGDAPVDPTTGGATVVVSAGAELIGVDDRGLVDTMAAMAAAAAVAPVAHTHQRRVHPRAARS